jgi:hypothetical protein
VLGPDGGFTKLDAALISAEALAAAHPGAASWPS